MSRIKFFSLIFYFFCLVLSSQKTKKSTIYFHYDNYYTLGGDNYMNLPNNKKFEVTMKSLYKTKTNGYIFFSANEVFNIVKPKAILSLQDYIEKREFYYAGIYNNIVSNNKLKRLLLDKFEVFLVKDNKFYKVKTLLYNSYKPKTKEFKKIHNNIKDTLFFDFDKKYLNVKNENYFIKDQNKDETFGFVTKKKHLDLNFNNKYLSLKSYIRVPLFYRENKIQKLLIHNLIEHFSNYIVIIKNKSCFVEVQPYIETY